MKFVCTSDIHYYKTKCFPPCGEGDILIIAGDHTGNDSIQQWDMFCMWFERQKFKYKIFIAGNHDARLVRPYEVLDIERKVGKDCHYLCDTSIVIEGIKIHGTPWTPPFQDWHFMADNKGRDEKFSLIPNDTDILISHGPPFGILDSAIDKPAKIRCGDKVLLEHVKRVKPKFHVFGHIHKGYGRSKMLWKIEEGDNPAHTQDTIFINCARCNENYDPVNEPIEFEL